MVKGTRERISLQTLTKYGEITCTTFTSGKTISIDNERKKPKYIFKYIYDRNQKLKEIKVFDIIDSMWSFTYDTQTLLNTFDSIDISHSNINNKKILIEELKKARAAQKDYNLILLKLFLINNLS